MTRSWLESTARMRVQALVDTESFVEFAPPSTRMTSPHLAMLGVSAAFDDGVIVGRGALLGRRVFVAAQEGGFLGGAVGEVHGAKIVGVLERALVDRADGVLLLLESGGVRLHEANAGLIAISEIMRAVLNVRNAGIPVVAVIGGRYGCFGGMGIVARLCDSILMSEEARLGLSGPEVIESVCGVEEFDASDRALVWRTVGGKQRFILGEVAELVADDVKAFRAAASRALATQPDLSLAALEAEHRRLSERVACFGDCVDASEIWKRLGIDDTSQLTLAGIEEFLIATAGKRA